MSAFQKLNPVRPALWSILTPAFSSALVRPLTVTLAIIVTSICGQFAHAEPSCKSIQFQAGASSATVSGSIDPEATQCFQFAAGEGQSVHVAITSKDQNTIFSIPGLVDARDEYTFKSQKQTYEIVIGQLMRSATADSYQLLLSIE